MQERKEFYTERFLKEWKKRIEKSRTPRGDSKITNIHGASTDTHTDESNPSSIHAGGREEK